MALDRAGIEHGRATRTGLDDPITVVPVSVVKGLELDGVVVVEPARIVADEIQGLRALYVALTRPTQRLTVIHAELLPACPRRSITTLIQEPEAATRLRRLLWALSASAGRRRSTPGAQEADRLSNPGGARRARRDVGPHQRPQVSMRASAAC